MEEELDWNENESDAKSELSELSLDLEDDDADCDSDHSGDEGVAVDIGHVDAPVFDVGSAKRYSPGLVSIYERTRVLGLRASHLEQGVAPLVEWTAGDDAYKIALREYGAGKLGFFKVRREMAHRVEIFSLSELRLT